MADDDQKTTSTSDMEFITFAVAGQSYGLDIQQIREIRRWSSVTVLPHAPASILGVMNLRGAVIPIYDLACHFGLGQTQHHERNVVIVAAYGGQTIGLLVEAVCEILTVNTDDIQATPDVKSDATKEAILGVISQEDDMTRIIDLKFVTDLRPSLAA